MRALADPEVRRRLNEGAHSEDAGILRGLANWERLIIVESFAPENDYVTGRTVGEVAGARGGEAFDTLLDVVIADELRTGLSPRPFGDDEADWKMRAEVWRNGDAVIGGSDAGAHRPFVAPSPAGAGHDTPDIGSRIMDPCPRLRSRPNIHCVTG
jgi:N-acyl-D-aspartate/D-glutamate deacylase